MAPLLFFAFVAGLLTILSPCVLPVVPLVAGSSAAGGRRRLTGIVVGFAASFVVVTVVLASTLAAAGITTDRLRLASAVLLGILGATIAVPRLGAWVEARSSRLAQAGTDLVGHGRPDAGFTGGALVGAASGLIWAPCAGPIMATVIAAAVTAGPSTGAALVAVAYAIGAAIPLVTIGVLGRRAVFAVGGAERRARAVQAFGALTVAAAVLVVTGLDVPVQTAVADVLPPGWADGITAVEQAPPVAQELGMPVNASPASGNVPLDDLGPAPELRGITSWINADPQSLAALRGKVVLVHFWTFGCINCIHVQPYVKAWYDKYEDAGLVVIGVHTPELSFERDLDNVRAAVADDGVRFPVAFDPAFATWNAYGNHYWPAFYFIDRTGHIRHVHAGEGDYDGSEQVIRELLAEPG